METPDIRLGGLPEFLAFLTSAPEPDALATALVTGPGRIFDAAIAAILVLDGDELRVIGRHGYLHADSAARYPLWDDLPVSQAVREGTVIVCDSERAELEFADLGPAWEHAPELAGRRSIVSGPIISRGTTRGGYFMACDSPPSWATLDYALLEGVGRCLALWLEHPSGAVHLARQGDAVPVTLSPRQRAVLDLLIADRTTAAIAATLGCSVSTVKADVNRIGRALGVTGRAGIVNRARELGLDSPGGSEQASLPVGAP